MLLKIFWPIFFYFITKTLPHAVLGAVVVKKNGGPSTGCSSCPNILKIRGNVLKHILHRVVFVLFWFLCSEKIVALDNFFENFSQSWKSNFPNNFTSYAFWSEPPFRGKSNIFSVNIAGTWRKYPYFRSKFGFFFFSAESGARNFASARTISQGQIAQQITANNLLLGA
jgi:hypothetical protein